MAPTVTQNAILIRSRGVVELARDVPMPKLRDDHILVKTVAVALNPTDWKHIDFVPTIGALVGCDYAGIVEEVGPGVTKSFKKGDRVAGFMHGSEWPQERDPLFVRFCCDMEDDC
jgi:NADPH:quinone reductase-like Zn-dependent oxidoreductase